MSLHTIYLPWKKSVSKNALFPFFLPFAGCPQRCIFCAQDIQTGKKLHQNIEADLRLLEGQLRARFAQKKEPVELAFYGGTFTLLPRDTLTCCFAYTNRWLAEGLISSLRCSTRPDAVSCEILQVLKEAHFTTIELGVQSFYSKALDACRRGYSADVAFEGCERVRRYGFRLGIQLLPGLPTQESAHFLNDVQLAEKLKCQYLRFYPCLVLSGTELAQLYQEGRYEPWDLETTVEILSKGAYLAFRAGIDVIRMGLVPQKELLCALVAGPFCADLGSRVQARVLYHYVTEHLAKDCRIEALLLPHTVQGFFWGHGREMEKMWQERGVTQSTVSFQQRMDIEMRVNECSTQVQGNS